MLIYFCLKGTAVIPPAPACLGRVATPPQPAAILDHRCEEPKAASTSIFTNTLMR